MDQQSSPPSRRSTRNARIIPPETSSYGGTGRQTTIFVVSVNGRLKAKGRCTRVRLRWSGNQPKSEWPSVTGTARFLFPSTCPSQPKLMAIESSKNSPATTVRAIQPPRLKAWVRCPDSVMPHPESAPRCGVGAGLVGRADGLAGLRIDAGAYRRARLGV